MKMKWIRWRKDRSNRHNTLTAGDEHESKSVPSDSNSVTDNIFENGHVSLSAEDDVGTELKNKDGRHHSERGSSIPNDFYIIFEHRKTKVCTVVHFTGDGDTAKLLNKLRMARTQWRELKYMPLVEAISNTVDEEELLAKEVVMQRKMGKHVKKRSTDWNIERKKSHYSGISFAPTITSDIDHKIIGPTCRICGDSVSNNEVLEEHLKICHLKDSVKKKCQSCNDELKQLLQSVQGEIEGNMSLMLQTAFVKFESKSAELSMVKKIVQKALCLDSVSATAVNDGRKILTEISDAEAHFSHPSGSKAEPNPTETNELNNEKLEKDHLKKGRSNHLHVQENSHPTSKIEELDEVHNNLAHLLKNASKILAKKVMLAKKFQEESIDISTSGLVKISDFTLIRPLNEGGSAKVFLGRKIGTGTFYAIKVMNKSHIKDLDMERRVLQERKIMSLLGNRNPYVVQLYFAFRSEKFLYLVLEYVNGGDCKGMLQAVHRLSHDVALFLIAEAVLAIEFLHNHGIVHRDIKPDNVMLTKDGHVKLVDFGLSRVAKEVPFGKNLTMDFERELRIKSQHYESRRSTRISSKNISRKSGSSSGDTSGSFSFRPIVKKDKLYSPVGTSRYVAPEIILNIGHDHRVDWWSLGVLLFELLVGSTPFDADNIDEIYDNILLGNIQWPEEDILQPAAKDLIIKLLTINPNQRLGKEGAGEVKAHPFFAGVEWDTLYLQKSPFVPQLSSNEDTSYFERTSKVSVPTLQRLSQGGTSGIDQGVPDHLPDEQRSNPRAHLNFEDDPDFNSFSYVNFHTIRNLKDATINVGNSPSSRKNRSEQSSNHSSFLTYPLKLDPDELVEYRSSNTKAGLRVL